MEIKITRRRFLEGASVLALSLGHLNCSGQKDKTKAAVSALGEKIKKPFQPYGNWQDLYREKWQWDKVVRGAHHVINCVSACPFNVYVKDGIVWREEQNAVMHARNDKYPDFNPRGCQKGVCYSQLMYSPSRLQYPLKRVGPRGGGKWKRITWDEALDEISEKIIEISTESGPECVIYDSGTANQGYGSESAELVAFDLLGSTELDGWGCAGDMPLGAIMTWGLFNMDSSSDDYFNSELILLWIGNPSYTRIPDAHFIWEARYNGSKVVSIAPDYNASTMHCDQWVNVNIGSDAALALGMAHTIIHENLYKKAYVQEQTDMPLLVREDTGKFLREADLKKGGKSDIFYLWDLKKNKLIQAPGGEGMGVSATLKMDGLDPALDTDGWDVKLASGESVRVRTVWARLKDRLEDFTPEKAAPIVGVSADVIRNLGREMGKAKATSIFGSWGIMKHHHSDLFQRGMILLLALTGSTGIRGGGLHIGAWYLMSGLEKVLGEVQPTWWQEAILKFVQPPVRELIKHFRKYEQDYMYMWMPALLFLYEHGGLKKAIDKPEYHDPNPGISMPEAVHEAITKGSMKLYPHPSTGKQPRMYIHTRVNPLRRWPKPQEALETLWPKMELIVGVNIRMSSTCMYSDIVLPVCGNYERRGIKYAQSYVPYYVLGDKVVDPLHETKSEWEISGLLMQVVQEKAKAKSLKPIKDAIGKERDFTKVFDRWTKQGKFKVDDDWLYYDIVTRNSPEIGNIGWDEAVAKGANPIQEYGPFRTHSNICTDYEANESVYSGQWFTEKKMCWPTLTGRQQFYIDHDWFLKAKEELPTHKAMPKVGGEYPLRLTGGHTRWSIHSTWRDEPHLLQLQRGEPAAWISKEDAEARGVVEGDKIVVFNDEGKCELYGKISPSVKPGQVIIYHAWENFHFKNWESNQQPVPSVWKALHMADYSQLHYRFVYAGPHHAPRGTTVDFRKATA